MSEGARRRALRALLALTFFTWGGFYLVVPLISVHYVEQLGWAAAAIGVVLAARQFTQQGLSVASGIVADRFGAKWLIAAGLVLRAGGFAAMAFASSYPLLLAATVVAAVGGGMFDSPKSATIAAIARPEERAHFYAQAGVAAGVGMTVGMQAGALLMRANFAAVTLVGGALYLLMAAAVVVLIPSVRVAEGQTGALHGIRLALRDRPFLTYVSLMAGQWFMSTQFLITLPLAATAIAGTPDAIAWVFGVNSLVSVALAYPLPRLAHRIVPPIGAGVIGVATTALGLFGIAVAGGAASLLLAAFVFSCGTVLVRPNDQTVTAELAHPLALGSYFGVAALSVAVGGGLGNIAGGVLYDVGTRTNHPALPWTVCASIGLIAAVGLWLTMTPRLRGREGPLVVRR
ncbi:MAG TPA: MFS transporter [Thermomicrobiales bacterium]|nr:MFS transporter [Thermomicrobiales bacterium]